MAKKKQHKKQLYLMAAVIVLVIIAIPAVLLSYKGIGKSQPVTMKPVQMITPIPGWKTYTSTANHFNLQYPSYLQEVMEPSGLINLSQIDVDGTITYKGDIIYNLEIGETHADALTDGSLAELLFNSLPGQIPAVDVPKQYTAILPLGNNIALPLGYTVQPGGHSALAIDTIINLGEFSLDGHRAVHYTIDTPAYPPANPASYIDGYFIMINTNSYYRFDNNALYPVDPVHKALISKNAALTKQILSTFKIN